MAALGRSNSNSSRSSTSSQSTSSLSPANNGDYDGTDCSVSIIFGQRGRHSQRLQLNSMSRNDLLRSSSQNSARESFQGQDCASERVSEPRASNGSESVRQAELAQPERANVPATGYLDAQAPRLLREMSAPSATEFSNAVSQLLGPSTYCIENEATITGSVDLELLSDSGSISFTEEVDADEEASTELPLLDYGAESPEDREPGQTESHYSDDASSTQMGEPSMAPDLTGLPESSTLAEIFRCFICLQKVVDAQLCPCCSKLVCMPCIKRWLTDQKSECPHCRSPLLVTQLVSCRFISELSMEVEKMQGKLGECAMEKFCPAHESPLSYFCTSCAVAVCSDCAILDEEHKGHSFERLSVTYGRHKKKIRTEAAGLRRQRKELSALIAAVDKNVEDVLKGKDECASELHMAFKRMQARLDEQLKCKLLALLAQKGSMTQEVELLDTILTELERQLSTTPKSDLIAQEPNMSRMLQDIHTRTVSNVSRTLVSSEFVSEVVPPYEYGELVLKNYRSNIEKTQPTVFTSSNSQDVNEPTDFTRDVVYSEILQTMGVTWRLKVYPSGSGSSQGTYLSVFLEMVNGRSEQATFEYGIEMLHRTKPHQRVVRKFSSDFEAGACWGYYQFYRINLLEKEGYILPDEDTLTLRFYVRSHTFFQQNQDLQSALAKMQLERDKAIDQVAVLRRAFAATIWQRRRRRASRIREAHPSCCPQLVAGMMTSISSLKPSSKSQLVFPPHLRQQTLKKHETSRRLSRGMHETWLQGGNRGSPNTRALATAEIARAHTRKRDVVSDWERLARVELIRKGILCGVVAQSRERSSEEEGEVVNDGYEGYTQTSPDSVGQLEKCSGWLDKHSADGKCKANRKLKIRRHTRASTSSNPADDDRTTVQRSKNSATFSPKTSCKRDSSHVLDKTMKLGGEHHHSEQQEDLGGDTSAGATQNG